MLVTYETKFYKPISEDGSQLVLGVGPGNALLSLKNSTFDVKHTADVATVLLTRSLTKDELRELATAATQAADEIDERGKFVSVTTYSSTPASREGEGGPR